jgi:polyphosphate kinase 2 (PPK2 family)
VKYILYENVRYFSLLLGENGLDNGVHFIDPRFMRTNAYDSPSDEEKERPEFWRFWRTMPAKGTIGIYVGSWYSAPIAKRVYKKINDIELQTHLTHINELEQELADDGTLIIKCWLHLKKEQQKKRLKQP